MKKILLFILLSTHLPLVYGQNQPAQDWQGKLFAPDIALPALIDAAIKHSSEIEILETEKQVAMEDIKLTKLNLLNTVSLVSAYNYGTLPFFGTNQSEVNRINAFALDARAQYTVGVSMNLPLDVVMGSRRPSGTSVYKQKLMLQQAQASQKVQEAKIRKEVIKLYQELVLSKTVLQHYQDALQSADINRNITDNNFRNGLVKFEEQLAAIKFYNEAVLKQEEARNKYHTMLLLMEETIGIPLSDLMNSI